MTSSRGCGCCLTWQASLGLLFLGDPGTPEVWQLLPGPGERVAMGWVQLLDQSVVKQEVWTNWCCMK